MNNFHSKLFSSIDYMKFRKLPHISLTKNSYVRNKHISNYQTEDVGDDKCWYLHFLHLLVCIVSRYYSITFLFFSFVDLYNLTFKKK